MRSRDGFTLIEVVIAIFVFAIGGLGLAASSAAITRQISTNTLRQRAVTIARTRAELASSSTCDAISSGNATIAGVYSSWTVSGSGIRVLDQTVHRTDSRGVRSDTFLSAVPCD